jgi:hypothetical protein
MGWLEAKHRRSEEKAEALQAEELTKIQLSRKILCEKVEPLEYDKYGVSIELLEIEYKYLSEETGCSDYSTDTYRLVKESTVYGRVIKFDTISPAFIEKYGLYGKFALSPATNNFPVAIDYSVLLNCIIEKKQKYQYKSSWLMPFNEVVVSLKHRDSNRVDLRHLGIMPDGLPASVLKSLDIIAEKDQGDIRTLFLLVPSI